MLTLSFKQGDSAYAALPDGRVIEIRVAQQLTYQGNTQLAFDAPAEIRIVRAKVLHDSGADPRDPSTWPKIGGQVT